MASAPACRAAAEQRVDVQVGARGLGGPDGHRLVRLARVQRARGRPRSRRPPWGCPSRGRCARRAPRSRRGSRSGACGRAAPSLASKSGLRFSRNARMPSWPSARDAHVGDPLDRVALHVLDAAPGHLADEGLGLGHRARARPAAAPRTRPSTAASRSSGGTAARTRPISCARTASKRSPVRNSSRAADSPILPITYGRDHGGDDAQPHLGEPELRAERGHRDVAGGDQARSAAQGRAVHARHHRLGRLVDGEEEVGQRLRLAQVLRRA